jgi:hypothetical protein
MEHLHWEINARAALRAIGVLLGNTPRVAENGGCPNGTTRRLKKYPKKGGVLQGRVAGMAELVVER